MDKIFKRDKRGRPKLWILSVLIIMAISVVSTYGECPSPCYEPNPDYDPDNPYQSHDPCILICSRCVGEFDFCGSTGGNCSWTGSWVCVNEGDCQGNYAPSSTMRCVPSDDPYICEVKDERVLTTICRRYCKVIPFVSCVCASERSQTGWIGTLADCKEELRQ